eukprot:TRINITY_DN3431_c0_g1_i1.p1 TRINITY_DN3431_c0_g1~~TRINITY_DN3431_c0_g1_i1.p1  ORF type:complete len:136 (+),score=9.90 TRINITY_DN3431_c0_g1_i1:89-496(+)
MQGENYIDKSSLWRYGNKTAKKLNLFRPLLLLGLGSLSLIMGPTILSLRSPRDTLYIHEMRQQRIDMSPILQAEADLWTSFAQDHSELLFPGVNRDFHHRVFNTKIRPNYDPLQRGGKFERFIRYREVILDHLAK